MTEVLYTATSEYVEKVNTLPVKRQVSVSGILEKLGVSRSGYHAWKKRILSYTVVRRTVLKEKIREIYDASHQNYGAPKITAELQKSGEHVSEKTDGKFSGAGVTRMSHTCPCSELSINRQPLCLGSNFYSLLS